MNNICNFKCIMCSKDFSHLIAKEEGIENPISNWGENEKHILKFMRKAKNLKKVTIAGGEPFYNISYLHKILKVLMPVAHNIQIHITTNGSNKIKPKTADMLNQFKNVCLSISVDSVGKSLEIQRFKSNWNSINENITVMREQFDDNVHIELNSTITAITLPKLPDLLVWANGNDAIQWLNPVFVAYPNHLRIEVLKPKVIKQVRDKIIQLHKEIKFKEVKINEPKCLGQILLSLENVKSTNKYRTEFDNHFKELKEKRGLDLYKEFPEFKDYLM